MIDKQKGKFKNIFTLICDNFQFKVYSGIPIFRTSKGNGNWFGKPGVRNIEGGIKPDLFYRGMVLKDPRRQTTTLYHSCECVNHLYLPTKHAFKTKDLSQFRQNENQYCTDTCVCNLSRTLDCISFPLLYQKKSTLYSGFKGTAKFINVLRQELEKCN